MAAFSLTTRLLGKSLHGTTIRHNATATPSSRTPPSLLAHLEPSQLMQLASPRIASTLSSFADDAASSSTRTDSNASPRGRDEDNRKDDDAAFSPYFRKETHSTGDQRDHASFTISPPPSPPKDKVPRETAATATTASAATATAVDIQPLLTRQELREWQTPHMPLFTPKQLEATLLEIRRRQRHRRRERERRKLDSDSSASSFSGGPDENDVNHTQQKQSQLESKKREAAILLPLCTVRGTPSVLFTRRSSELSSHASQISFPGGYFDEELDTLDDMEDCGKYHENELAKRMDRRLVHTAVREMHEELCFDLDDMAFFGNRGYFEYCDNDSSSSIASGNNSRDNYHNDNNDNNGINIKNDNTTKFNNTLRSSHSLFPSYQQQQTQNTLNTTNIIPKTTTTKATSQPPPFLTILGQTQPVPQMSGHKVTPIIATINYDLPPPTSPTFHSLFPGNPEEVDWIFTVPIVELMKGETSEPLRRWSRGDTARYGGKYEVWGPVFPVPDGVACYREEDGGGDTAEDGKDDGEEEKRRLWKKREGDKVWGLTASVLRPILYKVLIPVFGEEGLGVVGKMKESNCGVSSKL